MNISSEKGRISKAAYLAGKRALNRDRQEKIAALHAFKASKLIAQHMPASAYSRAVVGLKQSIKGVDQQLIDLKAEYINGLQPALYKDIEAALLEAANVLETAESYVRKYANILDTVHAADVLKAIQRVKDKAKQIIEGK